MKKLETSNEIQELNSEKIEEHIEKHDKLVEKQSELNSENSSYELEIQKNKMSATTVHHFCCNCVSASWTKHNWCLRAIE